MRRQLTLWGQVSEWVECLQHQASKARERAARRQKAQERLGGLPFNFPGNADPGPQDAAPAASRFDSRILSEIRALVVDHADRPEPSQPPLSTPAPVETTSPQWPVPAFGAADDPVAPLSVPDVPVTGVLPMDILRYFDGLGIMAIVGVSDPALKEKLANPHLYGWSPNTECVSLSGTSDASFTALHHFRLTPSRRLNRLVGQIVILSENGDVFLETVGPWGKTWMHRTSNGEITCREHRTGEIPAVARKLVPA